ncbi:glycoside hydrolase family 104 protein [Argonema antarcticum]|uniref:glycoside hydrolase family 24 protein n=1 Tax=Argonema antarcticum TaxID=2942763 RepID=UPI002011856D|nr:glycoside hydrolase family 104 protein [Argonema antarcticum]MCL1475586.1 glycoside hydrolase family 104 protein [Argonema antarcticum A004/B2]
MRSQLPSFIPGSSRTSAIIKNPNMRAALDTIAWAEGTYHKPNSGYNTLFGGGQISDLSKHPNICVRFGKTCSTAFGRYQGLNNTWFGNIMGNAAVTPDNQDRFAVKLLRACGVVDDILAGDSSWISTGCVGLPWASFPVNPYGQPQKSSGVLTARWKAFMK